MHGTSLSRAYGAARSPACVGQTSISTSGQCGSARPVSTSEAARSTKTTRRQRQLAECSRYLTAAKARQAAERLSLGEAYAGLEYVVSNEAGEPYHPSTLSTTWQAATKNLEVPQVRLHDARHTCATLMHLQGVPSR
jgi:integrase